MLKTVHPSVRKRTMLGDLDRVYSLYEICIVTRAAPARILGLSNKGHLGPGADADITIYLPNENYQIMFELPRYVIKSGKVIVEDGEIRRPVDGRTLYVTPAHDPAAEPHIAEWFEDAYSIRFRNYPVDAGMISGHEA
jgi:formylmethanofuran dehydrogenase subunit A